MNTISNVALFAIGITAFTKAVDLVSSHEFIGAGILVAVGLITIWLYEKLPASPTFK